jgi:hypothetical protein
MLLGNGDLARQMPPSLIEQQHRMPPWADHVADLSQVQVHARGVAERQDQGRALALLRADGTKDVGRGIAR